MALIAVVFLSVIFSVFFIPVGLAVCWWASHSVNSWFYGGLGGYAVAFWLSWRVWCAFERRRIQRMAKWRRLAR